MFAKYFHLNSLPIVSQRKRGNSWNKNLLRFLYYFFFCVLDAGYPEPAACLLKMNVKLSVDLTIEHSWLQASSLQVCSSVGRLCSRASAARGSGGFFFWKRATGWQVEEGERGIRVFLLLSGCSAEGLRTRCAHSVPWIPLHPLCKYSAFVAPSHKRVQGQRGNEGLRLTRTG